jgi:hypothetical protein
MACTLFTSKQSDSAGNHSYCNESRQIWRIIRVCSARYLYAQQAIIWDLPDNGDNYGCIVIAAACHFCPVNV